MLSDLAKKLEIIKISIKLDLAYLASAWGALVVTVFQIFVFYYIWMAVYKTDSLIDGISRDQIITYLILSRIIYTQISYGFISKIGGIIHTGAISMELLRPLDFIEMMFWERVGDFIAFGTMTAIPSLLICGSALGLKAPNSIETLLCFLLSLVLALILAFFFDFIIGIMTFYTNYSWGLQTFQDAFLSLFSGALIPLAFFPHWLRVIADILPFQQMSYSPVSIYLGLVEGAQIYKVLVSQVIWVIIMYVCLRLFYSFAIKRVTIQGG